MRYKHCVPINDGGVQGSDYLFRDCDRKGDVKVYRTEFVLEKRSGTHACRTQFTLSVWYVLICWRNI